MRKGHLILPRGLLDNGAFKEDQPLCEKGAYLWLLENAVFKTQPLTRDGFSLILERGQLSHSYRFLSKKWGWGENSKNKVSRFLKRLTKLGIIDTEVHHGNSVITICKYNEIQKGINPFETITETVMGQLRDSDGTKNKKRGLKNNNEKRGKLFLRISGCIEDQSEDNNNLKKVIKLTIQKYGVAIYRNCFSKMRIEGVLHGCLLISFNTEIEVGWFDSNYKKSFLSIYREVYEDTVDIKIKVRTQ
jgi:hypothetical protein